MSPAFPSTKWTLVRKLADPDASEDAFQILCEKYWGPVFAYLCRRFQVADAEDITQEFFFVVLKQDLFQRANPAEGKLRSWLLKSLDYCLANRSRSLNSIKRGGQLSIGGLDEETLSTQYRGIAAEAKSPADAFDKAWLTSLLHNTVESLRQQYTAGGKRQLFESLLPWLIGTVDSSQQAAAAQQCAISVSHFRVHLHRLRKRYSQELRNQILETLDDGEEFDNEVNRLFQISKMSSGSMFFE